MAQQSADDSARGHYRVYGVTLAQDTDPTGVTIPQPPIEVRYLTILRSDCGSSGPGGGWGEDPLAGRDVWLPGYVVQRVEPWSSFHPGSK